MTKPKRSPTTRSIPEELQTPMRQRLRIMRQVRKVELGQVQSMSAGTLSGYERHRLETMRLGDIFALSKEYNMTPKEFITFLLGEDVPMRTSKNRDMDEVMLYLAQADAETHRLLCDIIKTIVKNLEDRALTSDVARVVARVKSKKPTTPSTSLSPGVLLTE